MKLYSCNLSPDLNIGFNKEHSGYFVVFEGTEEECYYIIFHFRSINHNRFFFGGGHENVDRKYVKKEIGKKIEEYRNLNDTEQKSIQKRILKEKIHNLEIEEQMLEIEFFKQIKKHYLDVIFR